MSTEPIPQDLVAVHDLLRETLANSRDSGSGLGYGIAIFPRTGRFGAPVFGIATSGGESTVLTYRMLQSLVEVPVYVSGRIPATVREGLTYGPPRDCIEHLRRFKASGCRRITFRISTMGDPMEQFRRVAEEVLPFVD